MGGPEFGLNFQSVTLATARSQNKVGADKVEFARSVKNGAGRSAVMHLSLSDLRGVECTYILRGAYIFQSYQALIMLFQASRSTSIKLLFTTLATHPH